MQSRVFLVTIILQSSVLQVLALTGVNTLYIYFINCCLCMLSHLTESCWNFSNLTVANFTNLLLIIGSNWLPTG